ncbi:hypothetical protein WJU23_19095 [Prosthecobacter sp. SYSU 5D2]|uniref:hypothetical protein n=1 Tax=Prosthecobacter sp. SYSU 5D2 TaxID=3134134 RepID=UPI0031FF46AE
MKPLQRSLFLIAMALASCAPQYARMTRYQVDEPYGLAKQKLMGFHQSQERSFTLLQDKISTQDIETRPAGEMKFVTNRWAFDTGTTPQYAVTLTAQGQDSMVVAKELPSPREIYDGARAISGNQLGDLAALDRWIQINMKVKSRTVGEDKESPPIYTLQISP